MKEALTELRRFWKKPTWLEGGAWARLAPGQARLHQPADRALALAKGKEPQGQARILRRIE
jgi:hypothetical protein